MIESQPAVIPDGAGLVSDLGRRNGLESLSERPGQRPPGPLGPLSAGMVITCEHGGNRLPARYRHFFQGQQATLDSHRGFDPGALLLARDLAAAFAAPLVLSTVSRLLVDLNRSIGHPRLHSETLRKESAELRQEIVKRYYQPHRAHTEDLIRQAVAAHGRVLHVSAHSFTPELDGKRRNADIGLLYDPSRPGEAALCQRWKASLQSCATGRTDLTNLTIRRNYPYNGKDDGLTSWFRRRLAADVYVGIEVEINQKHAFRGGRHWPALRAAIVEALRQALVADDDVLEAQDLSRLRRS
ncbi:N-formylglutamate amidohydrolase [Candidatus Accumulibacter sp. ACC003]|uniref:N-formylglutamate amidohydrolase n=1 Tax=Candidatus Accumulibacter sp. ACC003 TaxID=2823334 RepID=UPI00344C03DC